MDLSVRRFSFVCGVDYQVLPVGWSRATRAGLLDEAKECC